MVLVAPAPPLPAAPTGADAVADPSSGHDVLTRLRGDMSTRPRFDPGLAGGVRAWLEDAAFEATSAGRDHSEPLVLGARQLVGCDGERDAAQSTFLVSRLVHALFRQLVQGYAIEDPMDDALEALRTSGDGATVRDVASLDARIRQGLVDVLTHHVSNLSRLVPRFAPGWMPRTDEYVALALAGGRVVLHGVFDLLVGVPQKDAATLCALGVSTGGPWAKERRSLHFLALLELLRSGSPPFRVALLESATGRYGVEDIREEHLRAMAAHVAGRLAGADARHD
jgi:hypothetical protein